MELEIAGQHLLFLPEKAALWIEAGVLLLADLHVGKAGHFRKNGIGLGQGALQKDLHRITELIERHTPKEVLLLGDLFHSAANGEWEAFFSFLESRLETPFTLAPGNHDRHFLKAGSTSRLRIANAEEVRPPFLFSHEPLEGIPAGLINVCGHLHPGVRLGGKGRMRATLPCFWLRPNAVVLPAFGSLTGLSPVPMRSGERAVAIAGEECVLFEG